MKTRFALSAMLGLMLLMSGNIVWAQGRGNGHGRGHHHNDGGRGGNGKGNEYRRHEHDNDRSRSGQYDYHRGSEQTYHHNHGNHHGHHKKVIYVHHHHRPVQRVVVHHHHDHCEPRYVYYRDYDVYYDNVRRVYISFSGRNWSISTELPVRMYYVDRSTIVSANVNYYDDDFVTYLDSRRPGGRHCDDW